MANLHELVIPADSTLSGLITLKKEPSRNLANSPMEIGQSSQVGNSTLTQVETIHWIAFFAELPPVLCLFAALLTVELSAYALDVRAVVVYRST